MSASKGAVLSPPSIGAAARRAAAWGWARIAAVNAAVGAAYFFAAKFGLMLAFAYPSATPVWPPTGIALAAFLAWGRQVGPAVFLAAFAANVLTAGSPATSLGIAAGNTLEGLLGSYWITRYAGGLKVFDRPATIFRFVLLAVVFSTMISPTVGVASLALGGFASWERAGPMWATWWLGDAGGAMIVAPFLILLLSPGIVRWDRSKRLEAAALLAGLVFVGEVVFGAWAPAAARNYVLGYFCLPALILIAAKFGQRETAAALLMLSAMAVHGTLKGTGPYARQDPNEALLVLQLFLAITSITALTLSAAFAVQRRAEEELRALNGDLESRVKARSAELIQANAALREEAALRQRSQEELARSNAELSMFASVASHELQEPLRKLVMFADLLDAETSPETRTAYERSMRETARRMQRLVDSILRLSRVTSDRGALESVDLGELARQVAEEFKSRVAATGGRIEVGALPVVYADPLQMRQLFENLVSNAVKFAKKGEPVVVSLRSGEPRGGFVDVAVQDSGVGFDEKNLPRIFKPFSRLHRRADFEGSGIGLAICYRIAMRHGGSISARSAEGLGSTFTVTLPSMEEP